METLFFFLQSLAQAFKLIDEDFKENIKGTTQGPGPREI